MITPVATGVTFDPHEGPVLVPVTLWGPAGDVRLIFALDTGATTTLVDTDRLIAVGYDPDTIEDRAFITTASGIELVPKLAVRGIEALHHVRNDFTLICHRLPATAVVDGVLGLDFLREQRLTVDFRAGRVTLE